LRTDRDHAIKFKVKLVQNPHVNQKAWGCQCRLARGASLLRVAPINCRESRQLRYVKPKGNVRHSWLLLHHV